MSLMILFEVSVITTPSLDPKSEGYDIMGDVISGVEVGQGCAD
jgi:hypothetical protein